MPKTAPREELVGAPRFKVGEKVVWNQIERASALNGRFLEAREEECGKGPFTIASSTPTSYNPTKFLVTIIGESGKRIGKIGNEWSEDWFEHAG